MRITSRFAQPMIKLLIKHVLARGTIVALLVGNADKGGSVKFALPQMRALSAFDCGAIGLLHSIEHLLAF